MSPGTPIRFQPMVGQSIVPPSCLNRSHFNSMAFSYIIHSLFVIGDLMFSFPGLPPNLLLCLANGPLGGGSESTGCSASSYPLRSSPCCLFRLFSLGVFITKGAARSVQPLLRSSYFVIKLPLRLCLFSVLRVERT